MEVSLTAVTEPRWVSIVWKPPPDLGTTNWPCTALNGPPKPKNPPPGRPWWGRGGRPDGDGVAARPPGDAAPDPDAGEPDVAAMATPAPASRAATATPARISGLPGSLRLPSISVRLPSGSARAIGPVGPRQYSPGELGPCLKSAENISRTPGTAGTAGGRAAPNPV